MSEQDTQTPARQVERIAAGLDQLAKLLENPAAPDHLPAFAAQMRAMRDDARMLAGIIAGPEPAGVKCLDWVGIKAGADQWAAAQFDGGRVELASLEMALEALTEDARLHVQGLANAGVASAEEAAEGVAMAHSILAQTLAKLGQLDRALSAEDAKRLEESKAPGPYPVSSFIALHAVHRFTRFFADMPGDVFEETLHFLEKPMRGYGIGQASRENSLWVWSICAMHARHHAQLSVGRAPRTKEDAITVGRAFQGSAITKPGVIRKRYDEHRAHLEELAKGQAESLRRVKGLRRDRLAFFAAKIFARGAPSRPTSREGWLRIAEELEERIAVMTSPTRRPRRILGNAQLRRSGVGRLVG
ncbi:MAG: hypothetical protein K5Q68_03360 [Roseococcus sp.]|nr:hypothetical protein [Roseococcus sp.]